MLGKILLKVWWIPTLALAFAVGWFFAPAGNPNRGTATAPPPGKSKSSTARDRLDRSNPAARHISDLLEEMDSAASPDSVPPAADRAAAGRAAMDDFISSHGSLTEGRVRFAHWLESDPKSAIAYWNSIGTPDGEDSGALAPVARKRLENIDPEELLKWLSENPDLTTGAARNTMFAFLAKACATGKDADLLKRAMAALELSAANRLLLITIVSASPDGSKPLEPIVRESHDSTILRNMLFKMDPLEANRWIRSEIASDGSLADLLKDRSIIASVAIAARGSSIDSRLALIDFADETEGKIRSSKYPASFLVSGDVDDWFAYRVESMGNPMSDWKHRLRMGEIDASGIMEEARRALPEVAAEMPDEFRNKIFDEVASVDPASAMQLISDMPQKEREKSLIKTGMNIAGQSDPQKLMELVATMPPTRASSPRERFQVWSRATAPAYRKYGESYVSWVTDMPPGIERDWALSGLSAHFMADDPEKSARLKSLKTLPAGWKPAK